MARRPDPPTVQGTVVLIGGTGDVGGRLVRLLVDHTAARIVLVSRTGAGAGDRVEALRLDIAGRDAAGKLPPGATVVNLTEATPPSVAAEIVRNGGRFLETSASPDYLTALRRDVPEGGGPGTAVLCVGTAPGLSTLMAAELLRDTEADRVDIGLELGMGRHYGQAATEWSIGALGRPYRLSDSASTLVAPGALRRLFVFGRDSRARPALGIGFALDGVAEGSGSGPPALVRTFLAIDPPLVTRAVGLLLRLGLGPLLSRRKRGVTRALGRLPELGQARTRIAAEVQDSDGSVIASRHVSAGDQAEMTAAMILATIRALSGSDRQIPGLSTIVDHLTFAGALNDLRLLLPGMAIETWSTGRIGENP